MYSELLLDHFQNPRNVGELPPPAVTVEVSNPVCGDILRLSVDFRDGRIAEARYKTRGCTASIAAGSALTELLIGKTRAEISILSPNDVEKAVGGLSSESKHAALLSMDAVRAILQKRG
jgi:nitrogen fixation protein NifU and related proteins